MVKTHNPEAGAPKQPLTHLLTQLCGRKQGSPGRCRAVATVHGGVKAAADRLCPSPRRKLKCCLTSSCSKINQSAPAMINHIFQFQLLPVALFKDHGVAPAKAWKTHKDVTKQQIFFSLLFFSKILEIVTAKMAIASLQRYLSHDLASLLCLIRVDLILSIIYSVFTLLAGLLHLT